MKFYTYENRGVGSFSHAKGGGGGGWGQQVLG